MIAGQSPRIEWRENPGAQERTLEEARAIAQRHGVTIPDDVSFSIDELGVLGPDCTACGPQVVKPEGSKVSWSDLVHDKTGKVPFRIRRDILKSDEAIVAVFGHEMYELERLRPILQQGNVTIDQLDAMTCPGNPGNFHDEAWERADELVERMRGGA